MEIEYYPHNTPQNSTVLATPKIFFSNYVFNNPRNPPQESVNSLLARGRTPPESSWEFSLLSLPVFHDFGSRRQTITTSLTGFMFSSNPDQGSLDSFFRPNTPATAEISAPNPAQQTLRPPPRSTTSQSPSPAKRAREDDEAASEYGSDSGDENEEEDEEETNDDAMDFQPTQCITETQAIGGDANKPANTAPR